MKASTRTWVAVGLFVPLAVVLLATFACLPAPVGDPETSKVDEGLVGAWQTTPKDANDEVITAVMEPWDAKTYLLTYYSVGKKDGAEEKKMMHFKAWVTTIGGAEFVTAQPLDDMAFTRGEKPEKQFWVVMRVDKKPDSLEMRLMTPDSELLKGKETREQIEAVIKANMDKKELYGDTIPFKKLGKDDKGNLETTLEKFGVGKM